MKTIQLEPAISADPEHNRHAEPSWLDIMRGALNTSPPDGVLQIPEQRRRFKVLDKLDAAGDADASEVEVEDAEFDTLYRAVFSVGTEPLSRNLCALGDHLDEVRTNRKG